MGILQSKFNEAWELAIASQPLSDRSQEAKRDVFRRWLSGAACLYEMIANMPGPKETFDMLLVLREEINELRDDLNAPVDRN